MLYASDLLHEHCYKRSEINMIYLDNSATTRVTEAAIQAVMQCMQEGFYNPSSAYKPAVEVERSVQLARKHIADAMGCMASEIYYTSGGTESNNMAIFGVYRALKGKKRFITSKIEHSSVYEVFRLLEEKGEDVVYIGVDETGHVRLDELQKALNHDTALVSIMHVNNETGAVNDISAISAMIQKYAPEALLHVDGVQAFCKLPFGRVNCDLYSISGHKFHAPKGVGALYVRKGIRFAGGQIGGGQENGMRSGTTNAPGILGMDAALQEYRNHQAEYVHSMRECKVQLAKRLTSIPDVVVNGVSPQEGAPHILNVSFLGVRGEVLLHALAQDKIYVSTGSACSASKKSKSRVLQSMGITGERLEGAIRFSLCPFNSLQEMDIAATAIEKAVMQLRKYKRR